MFLTKSKVSGISLNMICAIIILKEKNFYLQLIRNKINVVGLSLAMVSAMRNLETLVALRTDTAVIQMNIANV